MKISARQKSACETITLSISQANELATNTRKSIEKTAKWFLQAKAYLRKIAEAASQLKTEVPKMHPMLISSTLQIMELTESSTNPVARVISQNLINKAEGFAQQCANDIQQINIQLKQTLSQTCDLYEEFFADTKTPYQFAIRDCASTGYDTHCAYLRYSNGLDELDSSFRSSFNVLREIDRKMVSFEHELWAGINEIFRSKLPHAARADPMPPAKYHDQEYDNILAVFQLGIQGFRMPYAQPLPSYTFEPVSTKMKAKKAFDGKKVGEIAVVVNETVDVIDSSLAEWYKIRNSNGNEGYVPVTVLEPIVLTK